LLIFLDDEFVQNKSEEIIEKAEEDSGDQRD